MERVEDLSEQPILVNILAQLIDWKAEMFIASLGCSSKHIGILQGCCCLVVSYKEPVVVIWMCRVLMFPRNGQWLGGRERQCSLYMLDDLTGVSFPSCYKAFSIINGVSAISLVPVLWHQLEEARR